MFVDWELKYPANMWFIILGITAAAFFILSFQKKEKIMALLRIPFKIRLKTLRVIMLCTGLGLMVFSLTGPQAFQGYTEVQKTGMDIYILVDTSKSMLVSDLKPDRISIAKRIVENLLDNLAGDRIGFIPFASDAYIQMPLTDDYQMARMFLAVMDTDMISGGGTNLAAAIQLAHDSFERTSGADCVIIILSDGEEHDNTSQDILNSLTDDKVKVFTIGIGTDKGGLVPVYGDDGQTIIDYLKDESGNPVTSRLSASTLKTLAQGGHGAYFQANAQGIDISSLMDTLSPLERDVHAVDKIRRFRQMYQYFLGAGILLFLAAWFLPEGRAVS